MLENFSKISKNKSLGQDVCGIQSDTYYKCRPLAKFSNHANPYMVYNYVHTRRCYCALTYEHPFIYIIIIDHLHINILCEISHCH